ncbi:MAG: hypothetical protein AB1512_25585 [Thermodesulfobacteriota bacterium]
MKQFARFISLVFCCYLFMFTGSSAADDALKKRALLFGIIGEILGGDSDDGHYKGEMTGGGYYEGSIKDSRPDGQGTYNYAGGHKYSGEFQNGQLHGQGTFTWANGERYSGEFQNDNMHGQGTYTWPNGNKYVGEFQNGYKWGQGTFTWANGERYSGEFQNDNMHGQGTYTWPNGNKYVGEFQKGYKWGQGTFNWAGGIKYTGEWRNDKRNGQGTLTWPNGIKYVGEFQDEKRHGHGITTGVSGESVECDWANDAPIGEIIRTDENSIKFYSFKREDGKIVEDRARNFESYSLALEKYPTNCRYLNGLAWLLATSPDSIYRDGERAIALARKAISLEKNKEHYVWYLDTLAASYAEAGRFDAAVRTEEEAILLLRERKAEEKIIDEYTNRLQVFRNKRAWRDGR